MRTGRGTHPVGPKVKISVGGLLPVRSSLFGLLLLARFLLLNHGGKDLFHRQIGLATRSGVQLVAAVGPDRVRDTPERNQAFVIAVLVAVVNRRTWKDSSAIVFVGAGRADTRVGRP